MCSVMRNLPDSDCDSLVAEIRTIALQKDAVKDEIKRLHRKTPLELRPDELRFLICKHHGLGEKEVTEEMLQDEALRISSRLSRGVRVVAPEERLGRKHPQAPAKAIDNNCDQFAVCPNFDLTDIYSDRNWPEQRIHPSRAAAEEWLNSPATVINTDGVEVPIQGTSNRRQGWLGPVIVRRMDSCAPAAGDAGSLVQALPLDSLATPPGDDHRDILDQMFGDRTELKLSCCLDEDWNFSEVGDPPIYHGGAAGTPAYLLLKALHEIEEDLQDRLRSLSAHGIADFWHSWQIRDHLAKVSRSIWKARGERAGLDKEIEDARQCVMTRLEIYVQTRLLKRPASVLWKESNPLRSFRLWDLEGLSSEAVQRIKAKILEIHSRVLETSADDVFLPRAEPIRQLYDAFSEEFFAANLLSEASMGAISRLALSAIIDGYWLPSFRGWLNKPAESAVKYGSYWVLPGTVCWLETRYLPGRIAYWRSKLISQGISGGAKPSVELRSANPDPNKRRRGPEKNLGRAETVKRIVERVVGGSPWRPRLDDVCEALDENEIAISKSWKALGHRTWCDCAATDRHLAIKMVDYYFKNGPSDS